MSEALKEKLRAAWAAPAYVLNVRATGLPRRAYESDDEGPEDGPNVRPGDAFLSETHQVLVRTAVSDWVFSDPNGEEHATWRNEVKRFVATRLGGAQADDVQILFEFPLQSTAELPVGNTRGFTLAWEPAYQPDDVFDHVARLRGCEALAARLPFGGDQAVFLRSMGKLADYLEAGQAPPRSLHPSVIESPAVQQALTMALVLHAGTQLTGPALFGMMRDVLRLWARLHLQ